MSLTRQLTLLLAALLLLATAGSLGLHAYSLREALRLQMSVRNADAASMLAIALSQQRGDEVLMETVAAAQFDLGHYSELQLRASDGRVIVVRQAGPLPTRAPSWFVRALPLEAAAGVAQVSDGWRPVGRLQVSSHAHWAYDVLWQATLRTAALLAALGLLAAALAAAALRVWRRPLDAAVHQARALEDGRFEIADEPRAPELRSLTRSMNSMVRRLREVFDQQAGQLHSLQVQAHTDPVTGLANRRHFVGQLGSALAEPGAPGGALLIVRVLDLDGLNLRHGHEATDHLLAAVADVLLTYPQRVAGAFVGRLNGRDFALCLPVPGVGPETAASLLTALRASPAGTVGAAEFIVGGLDGLRGSTAGAALAAADAALAQAEAAGPFSVELQTTGDCVADPAGARAWRRQIADALDQGRVRLAEYPVLDARGELIHLECPLRVQLEPGGDFHAAHRWLALAARGRLLPAVDLAAINLALAAIAQDGQPRCVHVAAASLASEGFVAELELRLLRDRAGAEKLWLEMAESTIASSVPGLRRAAAVWRDAGARIGIEHAGHTLQALSQGGPVGLDYIKIDARFVRGAAADDTVRQFALGLVTLVHTMGLRVIAEGIDDAADLAVLWQSGFDGATGPAVRRVGS